jgi:hypothetical protein
MFGYVRPPIDLLSEAEKDRFQRAYCGLCHALGQRYGLAARFILNYDFTYLAILLSDGAEGETCSARCPVSPVKKRDYARPDDAAALGSGDEQRQIRPAGCDKDQGITCCEPC